MKLKRIIETLFGCFHLWSKWEVHGRIIRAGTTQEVGFQEIRHCEKCGKTETNSHFI